MTDSSTWNDFYEVCCKGHLKEARNTITGSIINSIDSDGNTVLHIASAKGYTDIVHLLLRYHALRTIRNSSGKTVEDVASTNEIRELVKSSL
jgi:ankyrin repeat protein